MIGNGRFFRLDLGKEKDKIDMIPILVIFRIRYNQHQDKERYQSGHERVITMIQEERYVERGHSFYGAG